MKVVLFCGGMGTRLKEFSETIPKPMVDVGGTPIIMHLMKYYAHFGHKEFILCLGYGEKYIKRYFLSYDECLENDFTYLHSGRRIEVCGTTISDWTITFVNTGMTASIGQRLRAVRRHIGSDEVFMANYADGLSDLDLADYEAFFRRQGRTASFVSVRPHQSFHYVVSGEDGVVQAVHPIGLGDIFLNGGFFIFRRRVFDYIREGEDLVEEPFQRMIRDGELVTYRHRGFWSCMDTLRDKRQLDALHEQGDAPWAVWRESRRTIANVSGAGLAVAPGAPILLDRSHLVAARPVSRRCAAGQSARDARAGKALPPIEPSLEGAARP